MPALYRSCGAQAVTNLRRVSAYRYTLADEGRLLLFVVPFRDNDAVGIRDLNAYLPAAARKGRISRSAVISFHDIPRR